jgi:hypothetical protein
VSGQKHHPPEAFLRVSLSRRPKFRRPWTSQQAGGRGAMGVVMISGGEGGMAAARSGGAGGARGDDRRE